MTELCEVECTSVSIGRFTAFDGSGVSGQSSSESQFKRRGTKLQVCHDCSDCKLVADGNPQPSCHTANVSSFDAIGAGSAIGFAGGNSLQRRCLCNDIFMTGSRAVATVARWRVRAMSTRCDGMTIDSVWHLMRIAACARFEPTSHDASLALSVPDFTNVHSRLDLVDAAKARGLRVFRVSTIRV